MVQPFHRQALRDVARISTDAALESFLFLFFLFLFDDASFIVGVLAIALLFLLLLLLLLLLQHVLRRAPTRLEGRPEGRGRGPLLLRLLSLLPSGAHVVVTRSGPGRLQGAVRQHLGEGLLVALRRAAVVACFGGANGVTPFGRGRSALSCGSGTALSAGGGGRGRGLLRRHRRRGFLVRRFFLGASASRISCLCFRFAR